MQSLLTTVVHRPYVFVFLAAFLTIGFLNRGLGRTLLFLVLGYSIAFLSEFSSIRNGFPYGMYHYVYENLEGEILLGGVPVWDSLSYSFLAYAAYETAEYFRPPPTPSLVPQKGAASLRRGRGGGLITGAILMVLLDVVVDPLAVRGEKWFLGKIFYYPEGGIYFGVPLSNFAGWFFVALAIIGSYQFLEKMIFKSPPPLERRAQRVGAHLIAPLLGPRFSWGILVFNLTITFWIGEWALGLTGFLIHLAAGVILISVLFFLSRRTRAPSESRR